MQIDECKSTSQTVFFGTPWEDDAYTSYNTEWAPPHSGHTESANQLEDYATNQAINNTLDPNAAAFEASERLGQPELAPKVSLLDPTGVDVNAGGAIGYIFFPVQVSTEIIDWLAAKTQHQFDEWRLGKPAASYRRKRPRQRPSTEADDRIRLLACPFYKFDPIRHHKCGDQQLDAIARVKQHVNRRHRCSRCCVIFANAEERDEHACDDCEEQPGAAIHGNDTSKQEHVTAMKKRVDTKMTLTEQWCVLFRAFFPREPLPVSPWVDADLVSITIDWQQFVREAWPSVWVALRRQIIESLGAAISTSTERQLAQTVLGASRTGLIRRVIRGERPIGPEWTSHLSTTSMDAGAGEPFAGIQTLPIASNQRSESAIAATSSATLSQWPHAFPDGYGGGASSDTIAEAELDWFIYARTSY